MEFYMFIVSLISRKGGTGKTTIAVHLAVAALQAGLRTLLIDLDPQASASKWSDIRGDDELVVVSTHASRLEQVLHTAKQEGVEFVIIDTASKTEDDAEEAARAADLALIPCRPAMFDLHAISSTVRICNRAKTPGYIVFNADDARSNMGLNAKLAIDIFDATRAPCVISNLVAFQRSVISGRTAQEVEPNSKASSQIGALWKYLIKELKLKEVKGESSR
jgi:chromosome partitioning protein